MEIDILTAQFLHLQNNLPLFFTVVAFRSNNLSPHPHTFDAISEDEPQLCDIFEPIFLCVKLKPLLPLFITDSRRLLLPQFPQHEPIFLFSHTLYHITIVPIPFQSSNRNIRVQIMYKKLMSKIK